MNGACSMRLSAAALIIVLHDPQAIYDISFQLSFLSVRCRCLVARAIRRALGSKMRSLRRGRALIGQWISDAVLHERGRDRSDDPAGGALL